MRASFFPLSILLVTGISAAPLTGKINYAPRRLVNFGRIGRRVETRQRTTPGPPGWGLGGGLIIRSQKMLHITETDTRITNASYREAGVKDVSIRLGQRAKQRMTADEFAVAKRVCEDRAMECKDNV